jgi:hypothetical protein
MTFRGLEIWDLGIMTRVGVRKLGEIDGTGLEDSSNVIEGWGGGRLSCGHVIKGSSESTVVRCPPIPGCVGCVLCLDPVASGRVPSRKKW